MNFRMKIKTGSVVAIAIATFGLSGCFVFERLPFNESELENLSETPFFDDLRELAQQDIPDEAESLLEGIDPDESDDVTYAISDEYILSFEKQEKGWHPRVLMKNDSHLIACEILADDDIKAPAGITLTPPKEEEINNAKQLTPEEIEPLGSEDIFPATVVSGSDEAMKDFILELSSSSLKMCLAIPFDFIANPPTSE